MAVNPKPAATAAPPGPLELESPAVGAGDRLGATLLFALLLHAVLIVGVGFHLPGRDGPPRHPTLDVVLVKKRAQPPAEEAEYLAQVSQEGAGNTAERTRPEERAERPAPLPTPPNPVPPGEPAEARPAEAPQPQLTRTRAERKVPRREERPAPRNRGTLDVDKLLALSRETEQLNSSVDESQSIYSRRPRQKYITASTREHEYAFYMAAWVEKVERVGNLNYPDEARRRRLSGQLVLDVALNPDGTINNVALLRSSGEKVLDDAAIRIVRLAAPYAPFSDKMRRDTDLLHITKAWQFLGNDRWQQGK